jgi:hypothetical protein
MGALELGVASLIGAGLWIWMARANKRGRPWARITATVFFGILTAGELSLLIEFLASGSSLAALYLGVDVSLFFVYWLVALSAVVLLWRRSASDYYTAAANQAKADRLAARKPHGQPAVRQVTGPGPN